MNYHEFIKNKAIVYQPSGFDCTERNENLFGWQNDVVRWALRKGKCAIFSDCGTGKTRMLLQWANMVHKHENKAVLILAPLAVAQQTKAEGVLCGIELWTNPGDIVLTPFMGIGSEAYTAVKMGRKAVGVELKDSYYRQAVANVKNALENVQMDITHLMDGGNG